MKARSIFLVLFLVVSLFLVAGCGPQVYKSFYGEAIHTYTPPSTPNLADVPRQFLYDDDSNLILSFRDDIVAPSSYNLDVFNGFLRTKMCSIVTGAGYQCTDMNNNPITGSFFSPLTGASVSSITGAATVADATTTIYGCRRRAGSGYDHYVSNVYPCNVGAEVITQSVLGRVFPTSQIGTTPLRFCYRDIPGDFPDEYLVAIGNSCPADTHYDDTTGLPEILGYVYASQQPGTVPITQCKMPAVYGDERYVVTGTACVNTADTPVLTFYTYPFCSDSDGGKNIGVKGIVTVPSSSQDKPFEDYCTDDTSFVKEFYCDPTLIPGILNKESIPCDSGTSCVDGACVPMLTPGFTVDKSSVYNAAASRIDYTIVVRNTGDKVTAPGVLNIVDTIPGNIESINTNSIIPVPSTTMGSDKLVWTFASFDDNTAGTAYTVNTVNMMPMYASEGVFTITFSVNVAPSLYANVTNKVNVSIYGASFTDSDTVQVGTAPLPASASEASVTIYACRKSSSTINGGFDHYVHSSLPCGMDNYIGGTSHIAQQVLGRVFPTPKPGTKTLNFCYDSGHDDYYVNVGDCNYDNRPGIPYVLGYVYETQLPGTVPVTRCRMNSNGEKYTMAGSMCNPGDIVEMRFYVYPVCTETDGGKATSIAGSATTINDPNKPHVDSCVSGTNMVNEYYCDISYVPDVLRHERLECGDGRSCSDGACIPGLPISQYSFELKKDSHVISDFDRKIEYSIRLDNLGQRMIAPMFGILTEYLPEGTTLIDVSPAPSFIAGNKIQWMFNRFDSEAGKGYDVNYDEMIGYNVYRSEGLFEVRLNVSVSPLITAREIVNQANFTINGSVVASDSRVNDVPESLVPGVVFNLTKNAVYDSVAGLINYTIRISNLGKPITGSSYQLVLQDLLPPEIIAMGTISPAPSLILGSKPVWIFNSFENTTSSAYTATNLDQYSSSGVFIVNLVGRISSNIADNTPINNYANLTLLLNNQPVYLVEATNRVFAGAQGLSSYKISIPSAITPAQLSTGAFTSHENVLIGTCNDNGWIATALGGAECTALTPGKALLLLTSSPDRLIIAAGDATGVAVAMNVLSNSANYNVHGPRVDITYSGSSITGISFPHCSDDIQNFDESGLDCGGSCPACPGSSYPPATSGGGGGGSRSGGGRTSTVPTAQPGPECYDDWICTAWTPCNAAGLQTRTCGLNDYPDCTLIIQKPSEQQSCKPTVVTPPVGPSASCFDGIQNQGEENVDCGGPCMACPSKGGLLVPVVIILGLTAAALGFLVYYVKFLKKPDVLSPLRKYVKDAKSKNIPDARIKQILVNQGWSQTDIGKVMK